MILSKENLTNITAAGIQKPADGCFELPERVLQFGTGVLLRGLPDYFIDKANKQNVFGGRVLVVKSTGKGGTDEYALQNGLFTHYIKGVENGASKEETVINASISRVLSAAEQWGEVIDCAQNENMQIIISNTTEVGLTYLPGDDLKAAPPKSFPGKLTAFLYARYLAFNGAADKGMVIIPTELIPDNGLVLKTICIKLAIESNLGEGFIAWMTESNDFCNSLVDCIVPGALPAHEAEEIAGINGYSDALQITSESFRLWVIETTNKRSRETLSFARVDEGVIITDNIEKFRELKLRLLNATHTFTCGLAVLSDFSTVKEAMANSFFEAFISSLMLDEIAPVLVGNSGITGQEVTAFAGKVMDRFRNPFIEHQWLSICMQYSSKLAMRCVPLIQEYYRRQKQVPQHMAAGIGAYILFMRSVKNKEEQYTGRAWGKPYTITDEKAETLYQHWLNASPECAVQAILSDAQLWGANLSVLPGFEKAVLQTVRKFVEQAAGTPVHQAELLAV